MCVLRGISGTKILERARFRKAFAAQTDWHLLPRIGFLDRLKALDPNPQ